MNRKYLKILSLNVLEGFKCQCLIFFCKINLLYEYSKYVAISQLKNVEKLIKKSFRIKQKKVNKIMRKLKN